MEDAYGSNRAMAAVLRREVETRDLSSLVVVREAPSGLVLTGRGSESSVVTVLASTPMDERCYLQLGDSVEVEMIGGSLGTDDPDFMHEVANVSLGLLENGFTVEVRSSRLWRLSL